MPYFVVCPRNPVGQVDSLSVNISLAALRYDGVVAHSDHDIADTLHVVP
jgi:hypothetical protein